MVLLDAGDLDCLIDRKALPSTQISSGLLQRQIIKLLRFGHAVMFSEARVSKQAAE